MTLLVLLALALIGIWRARGGWTVVACVAALLLFVLAVPWLSIWITMPEYPLLPPVLDLHDHLHWKP